MKVLLLLLTLLTTSCSFPLYGFKPPPFPTTQSASIEALRDHSGSIHCTVFSINEEEHLWMTAHHCVVAEDAFGQVTSTNVPIFIGAEPARVYRDFPDMDVSIIRTETAKAPSLKLASKTPFIGEPVTVVGHGLGWETLTVFQGRVAAHTSIMGQLFTIFDMAVFPGHSGGPVTDEDGHVVSVMQVRIGTSSGGCQWFELNRETGTYWK